MRCEKNSLALRLHITPRGVELLDPVFPPSPPPDSVLYWRDAMKRLLVLTVLTALTAATAGCCGMGGWGGCFGRRDGCAPAYDGCNECGGGACDACGAGAVGAPVISAPPIVTPGPAY